MTAPAAAMTIAEYADRARALAARFAQDAAEYDRTGAFPAANFNALREAGLLNITVDERYGGDGAGLAAACAVVGEIGGGEPSTALVLAMHYIYHALPALTRTWTPSVHEWMCREALAGVALVNVMRVEPDLGTPARGGMPATVGRRTAHGFAVSGHKLYATGSPLLRYFVTWGRTDDAEPLVGWFLVPREATGWRIIETWDHLGMRATGSHDFILEDVHIPAEYGIDLRPPGAWAPPDPVMMAWNNLILASLYLGVAKAARTWLVGYLHERKPANLGASLATLPRHQMAMGEVEALLWSGERLVMALAEQADAGGYSQALAAETGLAKYVATNNAVRAVDIGMSLIGNPGLSRTNPLERYHRDVLCSRIHMPQDDMVTQMAGRGALGV